MSSAKGAVSMQASYVVTVSGNLVCAIEPILAPAGEWVSGTPLEVGSALASNFARHGCIDGRYGFSDAPAARTFAILCLGFSKALLERRLAIVEALPKHFASYLADEQPSRKPTG